MEFLRVVGSRRSIRWFRPWQPVEAEKVQRILEAARVTGCPGNLQPWRAIVVTQADLDAGDRDRLLDAANRQRPHEQAPVWIYWFGDASAVAASTFLAQISLGLEVGMLAREAGWDAEAPGPQSRTGSPRPPACRRCTRRCTGSPPRSPPSSPRKRAADRPQGPDRTKVSWTKRLSVIGSASA